jgi:hypothetical protein
LGRPSDPLNRGGAPAGTPDPARSGRPQAPSHSDPFTGPGRPRRGLLHPPRPFGMTGGPSPGASRRRSTRSMAQLRARGAEAGNAPRSFQAQARPRRDKGRVTVMYVASCSLELHLNPKDTKSRIRCFSILPVAPLSPNSTQSIQKARYGAFQNPNDLQGRNIPLHARMPRRALCRGAFRIGLLCDLRLCRRRIRTSVRPANFLDKFANLSPSATMPSLFGIIPRKVRKIPRCQPAV